jgi:hypothetical protein
MHSIEELLHIYDDPIALSNTPWFFVIDAALLSSISKVARQTALETKLFNPLPSAH